MRVCGGGGVVRLIVGQSLLHGRATFILQQARCAASAARKDAAVCCCTESRPGDAWHALATGTQLCAHARSLRSSHSAANTATGTQRTSRTAWTVQCVCWQLRGLVRHRRRFVLQICRVSVPCHHLVTCRMNADRCLPCSNLSLAHVHGIAGAWGPGRLCEALHGAIRCNGVALSAGRRWRWQQMQR